MKQIKRAWHYLLGEPFTWLFYCFFQSTTFERKCSRLNAFLSPHFRLVLPIFVLSYPLALLVEKVLSEIFSIPLSPITELLLATAVGVILGINFGIVIVNIRLGIIGGIAAGIVLGLIRDTSTSIIVGSVFLIIEALFLTTIYEFVRLKGFLLLVFGFLLLCIVVSCIDVSHGRSLDLLSGCMVGTAIALYVNIIWSIIQLFLGGIRWILSGGDKARVESARRTIIFGLVSLTVTGTISLIGAIFIGTTNYFLKMNTIAESIIWSIPKETGIVGIVVVAILLILGSMSFPLGALQYVSSGGDPKKIIQARRTVISGCTFLVAFGCISGILFIISKFINPTYIKNIIDIRPGSVIRGLFGGGVGGALGSILDAGISSITLRTIKDKSRTGPINIIPGLVWGMIWGIVWGVSGNALWAFIGGSLFLVGYILVFYRLLLYPVSALFMVNTYIVSRRYPHNVFIYLHHSPLYWDEDMLFALPGLAHTLLIAIQQNAPQTLEEIDFIVTERPLQNRAARIALVEIIIQDLERRDNLRDIAQASERLLEILQQNAELISLSWIRLFTRLSEVSRSAARGCSPSGWQAKHEALEEMLSSLKLIHFNITRDMNLNNRLERIVTVWREIGLQELEELDQAFEKISRISNPYSPGPVLGSHNRLFVGRDDLVRQLEESLNRGENRPTFLLNGERRIGKTSTLKQLPARLSNRYLPIYYDLLAPKVYSSTTAFLSHIAQEIYQTLITRGILVKKLQYSRLHDASRVNEATVYLPFEAWLENVESVLEKEKRILLLTFDEFEKLEVAGQNGYLNLELLLGWFRTLIQNHERIALLFSGTQTFGKMAAQWATAFVNVQILKVSFLHPKDARQLIMHPTRDFPGQQIFGTEVVEEILHVTGCHPFFLQGVCSELIEHLNGQERFQAKISDVEIATNRFLKAWWHTYFRDLWERTDTIQQTCLFSLYHQGKGSLSDIECHSRLDRKIVQNALETLCYRDLIVLTHNGYQIATPIFTQWVEQHL